MAIADTLFRRIHKPLLRHRSLFHRNNAIPLIVPINFVASRFIDATWTKKFRRGRFLISLISSQFFHFIYYEVSEKFSIFARLLVDRKIISHNYLFVLDLFFELTKNLEKKKGKKFRTLPIHSFVHHTNSFYRIQVTIVDDFIGQIDDKRHQSWTGGTTLPSSLSSLHPASFIGKFTRRANS